MAKNTIVREIFVGQTGEVSSKRTMVFLSFLVMILLTIVSIFTERPVQPFIFEGFMYIVIGGLFSVASEKFSNKFNRRDKYDDYERDYEYNRWER
ncbi:hypothetical protein [Microcystis phage Mel-JY01]